MTDFGELLKRLRLNAGITQKQLADKIGISKNAVSYYEQSLRCPSSDILIKIARVFHVSADFLLGLDNEKQTFDVSMLTDKERDFLSSVYRFLCDKEQEDDNTVLTTNQMKG